MRCGGWSVQRQTCSALGERLGDFPGHFGRCRLEHTGCDQQPRRSSGVFGLPGDVIHGVLTPNFHAVLWTKEGGIQDLGTLPGDNMSEATGINNCGQIVGVSYPSSHAFIWQGGVMTDLNTLIPSDSPLALISTGDINDEGQITGQACIVSNGECTAETPAFLAVPEYKNWDGNTSPASQTGPTETPKIFVPLNVQRQIQPGRLFGRAMPQ